MNAHWLLIPVIISVIFTYQSAFKNNKLTCDNYTQNTYLYTITYMFIMAFMILYLKQNPKLLTLNIITLIIALIINIVSLLIILFVSKEYVLLKHVISLLFITTSSILLTFIFEYFGSKAVVFAIITTVILFITLSVLAWQFQNLISSKVSVAFFIVFVILIIAELVIGLMYPSSLLEKAIILIVLMVICYLVLVKTKRMIETSKSCIPPPDYVKESIGFIVSIENILIRVLSLKSGRRIK
jgi:FtsH-binding integral membrane protein